MQNLLLYLAGLISGLGLGLLLVGTLRVFARVCPEPPEMTPEQRAMYLLVGSTRETKNVL